ncbi:ParA family protein, partial [Bacillus sp. mrc49]
TNLAALAVKDGKKVLLIDADSQANASQALGVEYSQITLYNVIMGAASPKDAIVEVMPGLSLLPSSGNLANLIFKIKPERFLHLLNFVEDLKEDFDLILIDTPPSLELIAGNILKVSDQIIIPFMPELFGVNGLINVIEVVNDFKANVNSELEIVGIVGTMVDSSTKLHKELLEQAYNYAEKQNIRMFKTLIPRTIQFPNATAYFKRPATLLKRQTKKIKTYELLYKELEDLIYE